MPSKSGCLTSRQKLNAKRSISKTSALTMVGFATVAAVMILQSSIVSALSK